MKKATTGPDKFELIVFDWDGTLADTLQQIVTTMQTAINASGLEPRSREAILQIIGLGLPEALGVLYPGSGEFERTLLSEHYRKHYFSASSAPPGLFPRARDTLSRLRDAGYLLAVATGKSRRGLDRALHDSGLTGVFHGSRCADETLSKPHPQMLLEIMGLLHVQPERTLMVGDSEFDLQMANNAGVASIGVDYGALPASRLLEYEPRACISCISELPGLLEPANLAEAEPL